MPHTGAGSGGVYSFSTYAMGLILGIINVGSVADAAAGAIVSTIIGITIGHFYKKLLNYYFPHDSEKKN